MGHNHNGEARLDRQFVMFAKQMNLYLNHFPKHEKYGLALHIRQTAYEVYALMCEAQKRYHKKTALSNLDIKHHQLRMLMRLAFELGYFGFKSGKASSEASPEKRYLSISKRVDEMGCMIGGWIAANNNREAS